MTNVPHEPDPGSPDPWPRAAFPGGTPDPVAGHVPAQPPGYRTAPTPGYGTGSQPAHAPGYPNGQGTGRPPSHAAGSPFGYPPGSQGPSGYAPSSPPAATPPPIASRTGHPPRRRRVRRLVVATSVIVLGLVAFAAGGLALTRELGRGPTHAEVAAALRQEIATRWQRLPAGKIFPARIDYLDGENVSTSASLVGIARPVSCRAAFDAIALAKLGSGCQTVLRATYVDASGTMVATAGVAVMPSPQAASSAFTRLQAAVKARAGLLPLAFSGTIANRFSNRQRAGVSAQATGPYLFAFTVGYADGEPGKVTRGNPDVDLLSLGTGVLDTLSDVLTGHGSPCKMEDISC